MRPLIYAALAVVVLAAPAAAQSYGPGALPPYEVMTILRSTGLEPLSPLARHGANYVLRAVDDRDREVRVVVNARTGKVLSVTPVQTASRLPPGSPPRGVVMGDYERMPPGYIPPGSYGPLGPVIDDDDDEPVADSNPTAPRPPAMTRGAPPAEPPHVVTATGSPPTADGMLPPPPERFPQRAAPAAAPKPKPVKRAAVAPKAAPLPKPKPAASAEAPAPQSWPKNEPAQVPVTAAPPAPAEETPN